MNRSCVFLLVLISALYGQLHAAEVATVIDSNAITAEHLVYAQKIKAVLEGFNKQMAAKGFTTAVTLEPSITHSGYYTIYDLTLSINILDKKAITPEEQLVARFQLEVKSTQYNEDSTNLTHSIDFDVLHVIEKYRSHAIGSTLFELAKTIADALCLHMEWTALPFECTAIYAQENPNEHGTYTYLIDMKTVIANLPKLIKFYEHRGGIQRKKHPHNGGMIMHYTPPALNTPDAAAKSKAAGTDQKATG